MKIYPAMDLIKGTCVRLTKGDFDQMTKYEVDPRAQAKEFLRDGAQYLHIVDLDGAKDPKKRQLSLIKTLVKDTDLKIQVGGGVRTAADVEELLGIGVDRVIIGSLAVKNKAAVTEILKSFNPNQIVLAFDVRIQDQIYVSHGAWKELSTLTLEGIVKEYIEYGLKTVLCTDIDRDGTLSSPNFALYEEMQERFPRLEWIVSGGVSSIEDIKKLKKMRAASVVLGKALYEKRVTLSEALQC